MLTPLCEINLHKPSSHEMPIPVMSQSWIWYTIHDWSISFEQDLWSSQSVEACFFVLLPVLAFCISLGGCAQFWGKADISSKTPYIQYAKQA